jgi:sulfate transport system substrate-binding protein
VALLACASSGSDQQSSATLALGAFTTPREAYRKILPAFAAEWQSNTGQSLTFEESYLGSGAQARAIAGGFEADIAALSLEPDVETLVKAGLITHDWKSRALGGMITQSIVVIAVRPGNPKNIKSWDDLRKPGIKVVAPNPRTSGGAMWNVAAIYGAALRGLTSAPAGDSSAAEQLLREILGNIVIMDKGARESIITFEGGVGDAAITYENEVLVAQSAGKPMDLVIPRGTIRVENPIAIVDVYAKERGTMQLSEAFIEFLTSAPAQRIFAETGLRPVQPSVAAEFKAKYADVPDLFTVADLGGWPVVTQTLFGANGVFERAAARQTVTQ